MQGSLSPGVLPGVLREIYVERRYGLLHFVRGGERYSVRFVNGSIVHAQSNVPGRLGEIMVGQGLSARRTWRGHRRPWGAAVAAWARSSSRWAR